MRMLSKWFAMVYFATSLLGIVGGLTLGAVLYNEYGVKGAYAKIYEVATTLEANLGEIVYR